jgi:hypothetical protein
MSIREIKPMSPKNLEKILNCLPEPSYVAVGLYGNFDFTGAIKQAEGLIDGIKLSTEDGLSCKLENPSKDNIMKIYRSHISGIDRRKSPKRSINLEEIEWYLNGLEIKVSPTEIEVRYYGKEPSCLSALKEAVGGTGIKLNITYS